MSAIHTICSSWKSATDLTRNNLKTNGSFHSSNKTLLSYSSVLANGNNDSENNIQV